MDVDSFTRWVTLAGAVIAAITGVVSLRRKRDVFQVGLDTVTPSHHPETILHVVSFSEHPIELSDWGFIELDGKFTSIPMEGYNDPSIHENLVSHGASTLETRGKYFETGYRRGPGILGAFAKAVTQSRPRLCFMPGTPLQKRIRIRLRLIFRPNYFLYS